MDRLVRREVVGRCRVVWVTNQVGDRRLGDMSCVNWAADVWTINYDPFQNAESYEQPLHFYFYGASIYEGSLGSRNSVRVSVCPSVCHMRGLWQI